MINGMAASIANAHHMSGTPNMEAKVVEQLNRMTELIRLRQTFAACRQLMKRWLSPSLFCITCTPKDMRPAISKRFVVSANMLTSPKSALVKVWAKITFLMKEQPYTVICPVVRSVAFFRFGITNVQ